MLVCVRDQVEVSKHRHFEAAGNWQGQARPGKICQSCGPRPSVIAVANVQDY